VVAAARLNAPACSLGAKLLTNGRHLGSGFFSALSFVPASAGFCIAKSDTHLLTNKYFKVNHLAKLPIPMKTPRHSDLMAPWIPT
jgi:hypothetical protein